MSKHEPVERTDLTDTISTAEYQFEVVLGYGLKKYY